MPEKELGEPTEPTEIKPAEKSAEEMVSEILMKNPGMNAAALVQALKAAGISFEKVDPKAVQMKVEEPPAKEADTTAGHPAVLRDKAKESEMRDSFVSCRFLEAVAKDDGIGPFRFKTALIQEGMGNFRDRFFYSKEALQSAIAVFEGRKCYADHPSRSDEMDRPERSVRDIIGHFENVHLDESEDGCATLVADLILLPDAPFEWARSLVRHAVDYGKRYPNQEFVGLSINASGDAEPVRMESVLNDSSLPQGCKPKLAQAVEMGIDELRMVRKISEATSVDLVTEPGAKGKIISYLESGAKMGFFNDIKESAEQEAGTSDGAKKGWETRGKGAARDAEKTKRNLDRIDANKKAAADFQKKSAAGSKGWQTRKDQDIAAKRSEMVRADSKRASAERRKAAMARHKQNETESEAKEMEQQVDAKQVDHEDVEQDKALILDMIKKYMAGEGGEEIELDEAAAGAAHEAYEAYKEMGKSHDEAMKCAADAMALAKHMAKKKDDESAEACEAEGEAEVEEKAEQKESHVAKLEGRIAFLERALKEKELAETLDRKLAESGLGRKETDVLRKLIGKPKSEAAITEKIETFKEGFGMAQKAGGESAPKKSPFVFTSEKTGEKAQSTGKVDFAAFLKK